MNEYYIIKWTQQPSPTFSKNPNDKIGSGQGNWVVNCPLFHGFWEGRLWPFWLSLPWPITKTANLLLLEVRQNSEAGPLTQKGSKAGDFFHKLSFFFCLCQQHIEAPRPGIKPEPQQGPEPQQWQCWILNPLSHKETLPHSIFGDARPF